MCHLSSFTVRIESLEMVAWFDTIIIEKKIELNIYELKKNETRGIRKLTLKIDTFEVSQLVKMIVM